MIVWAKTELQIFLIDFSQSATHISHAYMTALCSMDHALMKRLSDAVIYTSLACRRCCWSTVAPECVFDVHIQKRKRLYYGHCLFLAQNTAQTVVSNGYVYGNEPPLSLVQA